MELRLHVGWETRVRRGTHVDRFRTVAVHIEANPVFTDFNVRASLTQLSQYRIQVSGCA